MLQWTISRCDEILNLNDYKGASNLDDDIV